MTSISTTFSVERGARSAAAPLALLGSAAVFAAAALVDLVGHPAGGTRALQSTADYVFTALLIPIGLSLLAVLVCLRALGEGHGGRIAVVGFRIAVVGLMAFALDGVVTLATGSPDSAGPLYPLAMLATIAGLVCFAVGADRARVLPRWAMPALTAAWVFGGPVAEGASGPLAFRGAAFIFAAVSTAVAVALARRAPRTRAS